MRVLLGSEPLIRGLLFELSITELYDWLVTSHGIYAYPIPMSLIKSK